MTNTFDRTVYSLCMEIDDLKEEALYWKNKYEQEVKERNEEANERLKLAGRGVANALLFAMSVRDDEHGNLVIPKEERSALADAWKV